ncbi:hypothetical protein BKA83DRAFT_4506750 [Pisolithus microcarpus]|nr:hypothetical protein BKA83DRAFT_4506750 [Pisolithus microcarpus]
MRMSYMLGSPIHEERAGGGKKFPALRDALEEEHDYSEEWDSGLDRVVSLEEWKSLIVTYECTLSPSNHANRFLTTLAVVDMLDCALHTLPPLRPLHMCIWMQYLLWAEGRGGMMMVAVYRQYLTADLTEHYASLLLNPSDSAPRPLEAAKLLLSLAGRAACGEYVSPEGKEEVGLDVNDTVESNAADARADAEAKVCPPLPFTTDGKLLPMYNEDEDPLSKCKLNIKHIICKDGLRVYKDQAAKTTFKASIASALTTRDFTQIFQVYTEFCKSIVSAMIEGLENPDEDEDKEGIKEMECNGWEKQVALWGNDDKKVAKTYTQALWTINPCKATANLFQLYINFARYYEGGASSAAEPDLDTAHKHPGEGYQITTCANTAIQVPEVVFYVDLEESIGTVESAKVVYDKIMELKIANMQIIVVVGEDKFEMYAIYIAKAISD